MNHNGDYTLLVLGADEAPGLAMIDFWVVADAFAAFAALDKDCVLLEWPSQEPLAWRHDGNDFVRARLASYYPSGIRVYANSTGLIAGQNVSANLGKERVISIAAEDIRPGDEWDNERLRIDGAYTIVKHARAVAIEPGTSIASLFIEVEDIDTGRRGKTEFFRVNRRTVRRPSKGAE